MELFKELNKNKEYIKNTFFGSDDVVFKEFDNKAVKCFMVYTDNIVDGATIESAVLTNMMVLGGSQPDTEGIERHLISVGETQLVESFEEIFDAVLLGDTAVLAEGDNRAVIISTKGWPSRGIPEASTEVVVQGPKDAFTEQGSINTVLIRRRIRDTALKVKRLKCGRRSKTDIAVMYLKDVAKKELVDNILNQIESINVDCILDSGYLEQFLEKRYSSPFPQLQLTERPDKAASAIYEGRVVVVVDNSPFVIILPSTLNIFFQSSEDYYERWEIMSFMRILRFFAAALSVALPGLYIALTVYRPDLIPTALALKISSGRAYVPFPTIAEVLIMETAFELLREAGVRLPSPVSSAFGIVGGIVIGSAAVEAGIVGPVVVIIAALSGICSFAVPNPEFVSALRLVKYFIIFFSAFLGLFGFYTSVFLVLVHLASLESYGVPYLYPFCGGSVDGYTDFKDSIIRVPLRLMKKRPIFARKGQKIRMADKKRGGGS
ncbi:spore germination protein [Lachnospiraceae bacterium NSJ-143]|nr:spore germination protein [Lachnospiraceae bacterium NSJ-143]